MNVLAIGAHPDDCEFGVFGTLHRHVKKGDKVTILVLTKGEQGGNCNMREAEATRAAKLLESEIIFGEFQDGYLRDNHKLVNEIEEVINAAEADLVYTHSDKDRHQDHRYCSLASVAAARRVNTVLLFETPSTVHGFIPQLFIDITDSVDVKLKSLRQHESQLPKRYLEEGAVTGLATYRAYQAGLPGRMAEAFEVVREVRQI